MALNAPLRRDSRDQGERPAGFGRMLSMTAGCQAEGIGAFRSGKIAGVPGDGGTCGDLSHMLQSNRLSPRP